jgi:hypothetical protein
LLEDLIKNPGEAEVHLLEIKLDADGAKFRVKYSSDLHPFEAADLSQRGWQVKSLEEGAERLFDIPNDNAGLESIAWSLIAANKTLDQNSWIGKFSVHRVSR